MPNNDSKPFSYYHPITVRFSDLDAQGHVNNAVFLSYVESARLGYYQETGIWSPETGILTGMVVARNEIDYLAPVFLGQSIHVGMKMESMGNKSFTLAFQILSIPDDVIIARGRSIMVAYDNDAKKSIPLPQEWRRKFTKIENQDGTNETT